MRFLMARLLGICKQRNDLVMAVTLGVSWRVVKSSNRGSFFGLRFSQKG